MATSDILIICTTTRLYYVIKSTFLGKTYFDHCAVQHLGLATVHRCFSSFTLDKMNKRIVAYFLDPFDLAVLGEMISVIDGFNVCNVNSVLFVNSN